MSLLYSSNILFIVTYDSPYSTDVFFTKNTVQIINDQTGTTLVAASSLGMEACPKKEQAAKVGALIAKKALEAGITTIVFDRNGYLYHGRVKEVADAARNGGLKF